jgi:hypothetical protein
LVEAINDLQNDLSNTRKYSRDILKIINKCELVNSLLVRGEYLHYAQFNNILRPLMTTSINLVVCVRAYLHEYV